MPSEALQQTVSPSLRFALRDGTADLHERLDAMVGEWTDRSGYARYLRGLYRFRAATENALPVTAGWTPLHIAEPLAHDLRDLDQPVPEAMPFPPLADRAALGALYVLEGSSLGARLLARRAHDLGFTPMLGARHLAAQTGDKARWPAFLAVLEAHEGNAEAVIEGARATFAHALAAFEAS